MKIGNHIVIINHEKKVVLANRENGRWTRLSEEVYKIIKDILENEICIIDAEECFENIDDYYYIREIYNELVEENFICPKENFFGYHNRIASVQLTNRCNLQCVHCCVDAKVSNDLSSDLDTESIKSIFDKLILWNPDNIMLSGGEPMIRPDFMKLLRYLRNKYEGKIILSTNSLLINNQNVKELVKCCDSFEISIDGIDEETCSLVRGKGVFDQVCKKVELIKDFGAERIQLSMVFSDKNDNLRQPFKELNTKLGTEPVSRIFSAIGRGSKNKSMFTEKGEEDVYIPSDYLSVDYDEPFGACFCSAGKKEIFVGADGMLYPCPSYMSADFSIGNILESDTIEELLKNDSEKYVSELIIKSHPQYLPKCKECKVRLFCWTCPGQMKNIKTESAFNKRCKLIKPILMERVWDKDIVKGRGK